MASSKLGGSAKGLFAATTAPALAEASTEPIDLRQLDDSTDAIEIPKDEPSEPRQPVVIKRQSTAKNWFTTTRPTRLF